ncbi:hypothetical protein RRG08_018879 [Elysia crispata]|uniref:Uncharacterized protein n=1 Tax=Elysia crispata TaxID=231223 RepID=A0AAE1DUC8_9GAST|nr:hypothetical protein RRG08_018879 [Elysia crispata]
MRLELSEDPRVFAKKSSLMEKFKLWMTSLVCRERSRERWSLWNHKEAVTLLGMLSQRRKLSGAGAVLRPAINIALKKLHQVPGQNVV